MTRRKCITISLGPQLHAEVMHYKPELKISQACRRALAAEVERIKTQRRQQQAEDQQQT